MRLPVCFVINAITIDNFAALFKCMPVDRVSDFMMYFQIYDFSTLYIAPRGFRGSGEKGYLFSGSWGSTAYYFRGAGEQAHAFGHCSKVKKIYQASISSDSLKCRWLLVAIAPDPHITI